MLLSKKKKKMKLSKKIEKIIKKYVFSVFTTLFFLVIANEVKQSKYRLLRGFRPKPRNDSN